MSHRSGRHTHHSANAIPVREFLGRASAMPSPHAAGALALRRPKDVALALTAATAIAFAPMVVIQAPPVHVALPTVHVADAQLTALVSDADIDNLIRAVNTGLKQLDATVANVAAVPGQTLTGALSAASNLTDSFWSPLISSSKSNPLLSNVLTALRVVTAGGLAKLAASTESVNSTITLTTGQVATLLTSTLTGSASTLLHAISNVVNDPLSLLSYAGVINAPVTIVGGLVSNTAAAVSAVGTGAIKIAANVITGATAQVSNLITAADALVKGIEQTIDQQQVNSLITIAQQIVTSPLRAAISLANGATAALSDAATTTVKVAATAVQRLDNIWLSNGDGHGVVQDVINTIAAGPLSPGSYVNVAGEVITGAAQSAQQISSAIVGGFLPLPFRMSATMVGATANALNHLADGVAKGTVAALEFAGVNPILAGTVYGLVGAVKTAISFTAGTITTALNAVASIASTAASVTGAYNPAAATPVAAAAATALSARAQTAAPAQTATKASTPTSAKASSAATAPADTSTDAGTAGAAGTGDKTATGETTSTGKASAASSAAETATTDKASATSETKGPGGATPSTTQSGTSTAAKATTTGPKTGSGTGSTAAGSSTPATGAGKTTAAEKAPTKASPAKTPTAPSTHDAAKSGSAKSQSAKADSASGAGHTTGGHTASGPSGGHDTK